jgi:hypothetical protein
LASWNRYSTGEDRDHVGRVNPTPSTDPLNRTEYIGTWPTSYVGPQFERAPAYMRPGPCSSAIATSDAASLPSVESDDRCSRIHVPPVSA